MSKTDEYIEQQRINAVKAALNMKSSKTKPHVLIDELLKEIGINYIDEYIYKYYSIDIYLTDFDLPIEIHGDYWHVNPTKYDSPKYYRQKRSVATDKRKHTYIKNHYDKNILYLWENDIYNDINKCRLLIELFINNNGHLDNYNSFNYSVQDDVVILNSIIIATFQNT